MGKRPTRTARSAAACSLAGVLALTGCGIADRIDGSPSTPGTVQTASGELELWLDDVCEAIESVAAVADQRSQLDWHEVSEPATAADLVAHLQLVETEIGNARTLLESVGAPPVDDGEATLSELRESFEERQDAVTDAIDFIESAASRIDPLAPAQIGRAAQSAYTAAPRLARQIERQRELRDAYGATPTCSNL